MSSHYITAAERLPEDPEAEPTLQIRDAKTKRTFEARVRSTRDPDELTDSQPLTVGPKRHPEPGTSVEAHLVPGDGTDPFESPERTTV